MDTQHDDVLNSLTTESVAGHSEPLADLRVSEELDRARAVCRHDLLPLPQRPIRDISGVRLLESASRAKTSVEVPVELPIITAGLMRRFS